MAFRWPFSDCASPIVFSPKTKKLAAVSFLDNRVVYLDTEVAGSQKLSLNHSVSSIAFSRTGKWLGCFGDQMLTVFDMATLQQVKPLGVSGSSFLIPDDLLDARVVFSCDEEQVLFVCARHDVRSWEIISPAKPTLIRFEADPGLPVSQIELAPNGSRLYCASIGVVVTDANGKLRKKLVGLDQAHGFSFSTDTRRLVFLEHNGVSAYEVNDDFEKIELPKSVGRKVVISPNGKHFALEGRERRITLHEFETGRQIWEVQIPERDYVTWPWPAAGIVLWSMFALGMYVRARRSVKKSELAAAQA